MDFGSIFGIIAGLGLIGYAIFTGGDVSIFVSIPSVLIVGGGTLAATSIAFPTKEVKSLFSVTRRVFNNPKSDLQDIIKFLVDASIAYRKSGPRGLEEMAKKSPHGPIKKGLGLIADGANTSTLMEILNNELQTMEDHHKVGQKIFAEMGKYSPAFGMVGTLIGLVQMLATLEDPSTIGPKMAVALLTTFYGALLANLLFLPMVTKLERRAKIEAFEIRLMIVGLSSINLNDPIQIMREKLHAFLTGDAVEEKDGGGKGGKRR